MIEKSRYYIKELCNGKHVVYDYDDFCKIAMDNIEKYKKCGKCPKYILMTKKQQSEVYDALDGIVFPRVMVRVKKIKYYRGLKVKTIRNGAKNGRVKWL